MSTTETSEWVSMQPMGDPFEATVHRRVTVGYGPLAITFVFRGDDLVYHLWRRDLPAWPPEETMRSAIGDAFTEVLGSSSDASGDYTEEMDSWAVKLAGYGRRTGSALVLVTDGFAKALCRMLEATT